MTEFEKFIKAMDAEKLMKAVADGFKSMSQAIDSLAGHSDNLAKTAAPKKATKKTPSKKSAKGTAIETVYGYISRARNGIDVENLIKKTGYDNKKVHNVLYKLKKQNKIKSAKRGSYVKM